MASILVLTPDPLEAEALLRGFGKRGIDHDEIRIGALSCVSLPSLDMLLAVGGNGKAQYGIRLAPRSSARPRARCVSRGKAVEAHEPRA